MKSHNRAGRDHQAFDVPARTIIECFGLRLRGEHILGRRVEVPLGGHPDHDAAEAIGLRGSEQDGVAILHSTSWRYDRGAHALVLTYLCCPDPGAQAEGIVLVPHQPAESLGPVNGPTSPDPSRPCPATLAHGMVLQHGIGHLAWLAEHAPELVAGARAHAPRLWDAIARAGHTRAGQIAQPHRIGSTWEEGAGDHWHQEASRSS